MNFISVVRASLLLLVGVVIFSFSFNTVAAEMLKAAVGSGERHPSLVAELPLSNGSCYKAIKMELANQDDGMGVDVLLISQVAQTHYGILITLAGPETGKKQQFGCSYYTSSHRSEVVLIYKDKIMDRPGDTRYVWYWTSRGTVVETDGRYGED